MQSRLYLWVSVVWLWCSLWTYLVLEFIRLLKSISLCLLPHLGDFQPLFCQIFFSSILSILFFWDFIFPYVRAFEIIPQVPEAHFFPVFSLFFRWFLLMYLQVSPLRPLSSTFYYWAFFKFHLFFSVLIFFLSLLRLPIFHLLWAYFTWPGMVMIAALKFLSANSTISWLFICWVILDCVLDIVMLYYGDSGFCYIALQSVDVSDVTGINSESK